MFVHPDFLCAVLGVDSFSRNFQSAALAHVLTIDFFQTRGLALANRCLFVNSAKKQRITKARVFWDMYFSIFGVYSILPNSVRDLPLSWSPFRAKVKQRVWDAEPLCIF